MHRNKLKCIIYKKLPRTKVILLEPPRSTPVTDQPTHQCACKLPRTNICVVKRLARLEYGLHQVLLLTPLAI